MIAAEDQELLDWTYGVLNNSPTEAGGFLRSLCEAATRADAENYSVLRQSLLVFRAKYPDYSYQKGAGPREIRTTRNVIFILDGAAIKELCAIKGCLREAHGVFEMVDGDTNQYIATAALCEGHGRMLATGPAR